MLSKNKSMKTYKIFIPLIQKLDLHIYASGNGILYAGCTIDKETQQFHTLITGFKLVDHKNGDTLNNKLENLRPVDYSMNNYNRHVQKDVNITEIIKNDFGNFYFARIRIGGKNI